MEPTKDGIKMGAYSSKVKNRTSKIVLSEGTLRELYEIAAYMAVSEVLKFLNNNKSGKNEMDKRNKRTSRSKG